MEGIKSPYQSGTVTTEYSTDTPDESQGLESDHTGDPHHNGVMRQINTKPTGNLVHPDDFEILWRNEEKWISLYFYRQGCRKQDVEDLSQEVAIIAWRKLHECKKGFGPWVMGIAKFVFLNYIRKRARQFDCVADYNTVDLYSDPEQKALINNYLDYWLKNLEPKTRKIIKYYIDGLTAKEIAFKTRINLKTIYYHLKLARESLSFA